jgi:tetratricopeptide (TPR) repeat protein
VGVVNQCEPIGPLPELAQGYVILALLAGAAGSSRLADRWGKRALEIAKGTGVERNVAWVRSRLAVHQVAQCRWDDALAGLAQSTAVAERVGDLRLREETRIQHALVMLYTGRFEQAAATCEEAYALSRRSGNRQIETWAVMGKAAARSRLGQDAEAVRLLESVLGVLDEETMRAEAICAFGLLAMARLRCGDEPGAYEAADRMLRHTRSMRPVAYWLQPTLAGAAEALVTLVERSWRPLPDGGVAVRARTREAVAVLVQFARHFPLGRPHALLWTGLDAWTKHKPRAATRAWARALAAAERLGTPYELARTHLEIARHLPLDHQDRKEHLHRAAMHFERLGCAADVRQVRLETVRRAEDGGA